LALGTVVGRIELWDLSTHRRLIELRGHDKTITALSYHTARGGDKSLLASGSLDGVVRVWDVSGVRVWDAVSNRSVRTLGVLEKAPSHVSFSPDGQWVAATSQDSLLRVWNLADNIGIRELPGPPQPSNPPVFSSTGRLLFVPGQTSLTGYDLLEGKPIQLPTGLRFSVAVARKAHTLAAGAEKEVRFYDLRKWSVQGKPPSASRRIVLEGEPLALEISSSGDRLFTSTVHPAPAGQPSATLTAWDMSQNKTLWQLKEPFSVVGLSLSPDGKHLATQSLNGLVRILEASSGKQVLELNPGRVLVEGVFVGLGALAWSPDGKTIASGTNTVIGPAEKYEAVLWEAATGKVTARLPQDGSVSGVAYAPDGKRLAVTSVDLNRGTAGEMTLYDTSNNAEVLRLPGQRGAAFSPDGRILAATGFEGLTRPVVRVLESP
jgi:WD40 repeat protein